VTHVPAQRQQRPRVFGRYSLEVGFSLCPIHRPPASRSESRHSIMALAVPLPTEAAARPAKPKGPSSRRLCIKGADHLEVAIATTPRAQARSLPYFPLFLQSNSAASSSFAVFPRSGRKEAPGCGHSRDLDISRSNSRFDGCEIAFFRISSKREAGSRHHCVRTASVALLRSWRRSSGQIARIPLPNRSSGLFSPAATMIAKACPRNQRPRELADDPPG